jgi:hypothetical protein
MDFMTKQALTDATGWVKKYSELEYAKQSGGGGGGKNQAAGKQSWWKPKTTLTSSEETRKETTVTGTRAPTTSVRVTRIALVSTVLALFMYNVHLYFSQ